MQKQDNSKLVVIVRLLDGQRYGSLESVTDYFICMIDPQGVIIPWHTGFENCTGYTLDELLGKHFKEFYIKSDVLSGVPEMALVIAANEGRYEEDKWQIRKDGSTFRANVVILPISIEGEDLVDNLVAESDLAGKKKNAERHRTHIDDLYRLLVANIQDSGVFMLDPHGKILSWNTGAERMKGYSASEIIGQNFSLFYSVEAIEQGIPENQLKEAIRLGRYESEGWRVCKDGSSFWANVVLTAIYSPEQKLLGFSKLTRNITEKRLATEHLRESLKELENIKLALDISTIVAITDKEGDINYVNDAFCRISKYSETELIGQNHRIVNSGYHPYDFFVNMWQTISGGEVWKAEIKNKAKDGTYYWVDATLVPFLDDNKKLYRYVAIGHDITERKELELQLEGAKALAENANTKKNQFLANMSHELRTPLNAVLSYSQMLKQGIAGEINQKQFKYANNIEASGKHLLDMVNDILDIAKIEAGKIHLSFQSVALRPLVVDLNDVLTGMAEQKQVSLSFYTDPSLDNMMADPARLRQIFFNLISNAIKFNNEQGKVEVKISPTADKQWVIGEVIDNGIGIPEDKIKELFTEFYQVDASSVRLHEGTGLGLALTRHLVQLHGGEISVVSIEGQGSTFTFKLPVSPSDFLAVKVAS